MLDLHWNFSIINCFLKYGNTKWGKIHKGCWKPYQAYGGKQLAILTEIKSQHGKEDNFDEITLQGLAGEILNKYIKPIILNPGIKKDLAYH